MTNIISKLASSFGDWSFKYNCYEAVHPWTPFCSDCALDIGATVFAEAIKLYTPLYLFTQLSQKRLDIGSFQRTGQSILRSTSFISANAFFALFFFCSTKYFTGKFYYYAVAYAPAFLASSMALLIEKPHRRASLAFYVANVASDALFRLWVAQGIVRPISNGQVYLFTLAIATTMYLAKKNGLEDDALGTLIKLVIGSEEANRIRIRAKSSKISSNESTDINENLIRDEREENECQERQSIRCDTIDLGGYCESSTNDQLNNYYKANDQLTENTSQASRLQASIHSLSNFVFRARHPLCPHEHQSCFVYSLKTFMRAFSIGYSAQLAMRIVSRLPNLYNDPKMALDIIRGSSGGPSLRLAAFLATFGGLFKAFSCGSRWYTNKWSPANNFLAALLAGPALLFYPSPTVALYVLWKSLEALLMEAEREGKLKSQTKDSIVILIYGLATSQLFYTALMNPRYMKKSYMSFLDRMSRHRLHLVNRSVLDVFGTQASAGYEDFFPDLHPRYMSDAFLGSIWIWMIEQKLAFTPISLQD